MMLRAFLAAPFQLVLFLVLSVVMLFGWFGTLIQWPVEKILGAPCTDLFGFPVFLHVGKREDEAEPKCPSETALDEDADEAEAEALAGAVAVNRLDDLITLGLARLPDADARAFTPLVCTIGELIVLRRHYASGATAPTDLVL